MFGTELKKLRKELGWTREELAEELGLSYHTLRALELNVRYPTKTTIKLINLMFCCDFDLMGKPE
jgi:transcriptional regulator with XRE-family HTH domain